MRFLCFFGLVLTITGWQCALRPQSSDKTANIWITSADQTQLLAPFTLPVSNKPITKDTLPVIEIDSVQKFQTMDGFGFNLTHGSAWVLRQLPDAKRKALLEELFGNSSGSIRVSYLRLSIGASDLSPLVFSYDDTPDNQPDEALQSFSMFEDEAYYFPLLKEIVAIQPNIKLMATPWSAPSWMKSNGSTVGGSLKPEYYGVYARYLIKYLQSMQTRGFHIDAMTVQNEPLNGHNNPSMVMTAAEQADFISQHLGPAMKTAGITTKILAFDHNCDTPEYPVEVLKKAGVYVDGAAFHLYGGDISAVSKVKAQFPEKNMYFTEQYTDAKGEFGGDLAWHTRNLTIGAARNWCKNVVEWNLANDTGYGPFTPGGCNTCKGALTVNGAGYERNVSYYIIAHASKFVTPGSVRIASTEVKNLPNVAWLRPDGKLAMLVLNDYASAQSFHIKYQRRSLTATLRAGDIATIVW